MIACFLMNPGDVQVFPGSVRIQAFPDEDVGTLILSNMFAGERERNLLVDRDEAVFSCLPGKQVCSCEVVFDRIGDKPFSSLSSPNEYKASVSAGFM